MFKLINNYAKVIYFFIIISSLVLSNSCEDERSQIPNVRVDLYLDLFTDLADLSVSAAKTWRGGYKGIIIYRYDQLGFYAYERTCPNYPIDKCAVSIKDVIFAECACCKSLFSLPYNQLLNGPARFPLKQYRTRIVGNRLHIFN